MIKSCSTCEHKQGQGHLAYCLNSGFYCVIERKYPTVCGNSFEAWIPRLGIFARIKQLFTGCMNDTYRPMIIIKGIKGIK